MLLLLLCLELLEEREGEVDLDAVLPATRAWCNILYCTILYYNIICHPIVTYHYHILYYTILYYTILVYAIISYHIIWHTILYYTALHYTSSRGSTALPARERRGVKAADRTIEEQRLLCYSISLYTTSCYTMLYIHIVYTYVDIYIYIYTYHIIVH